MTRRAAPPAASVSSLRGVFPTQDPPRPGVVRWWWVRHAPVIGPRGRILGRTDVPCDTSDLDALIILADRLPSGAVVVVSPQLRSRQTASALEGAGALLTHPEEDAAFTEQDFGQWEGRTWNELMGAHPPDPQVSTFWTDPARETPPGGESFMSVMERVGQAVLSWSERLGSGDVVVVAHAGTIRAAVAQALELAPPAALRLAIDPLSLTRIDRHGGPEDGWAVRCVNETVP
ncbi:histidine phosphatase family protein [Pararhodospirillum oryzae]|uniref:Phosphoglycerate mutase n=1 Tax=Pararhodospirillum oryzae TaxID=478448 RepID=A0A512H6X3_9PROT|nr:histidine phosphatase family protein [Pararhodospirillum oryzae]GEO81178.1 phosphoglycerate mutase [Pararhodospirillum oryzae]